MQAYPLHWPVGYKRTTTRIPSRFDQNMERAQQALHKEVERLQGKNLVVSTNLRIRTDGMLYAADMSKKVEDPGVAIYFQYQGKDIALCCDRYERVWENIYALAQGLDAIRSLSRWGISEMIDRIFTGFLALPEGRDPEWPEVLDLFPGASEKEIRDRYRELAKKHHPERGGDRDYFELISRAYKSALS